MRFLKVETVFFVRHSRVFLFLFPLSSASILLSTFVLQYFIHIPVCQMCVVERYPYGLAIVVGLALYMSSKESPSYTILRYLQSALFLTSFGLALYHVGLEFNWWPLPAFCRGSFQSFQNFEDLKAHVLSQTTRVPCDQPTFHLFGISLAVWNVVSSFLLTIGSFIIPPYKKK